MPINDTKSNKLNIDIINDKYSKFLPQADNIAQFTKEVGDIKKEINLGHINKNLKPVLIYSNTTLNPLYYLMAVNYSLHSNKVLDYEVVRAQTFVREHFADKDRDNELHGKIFYSDLLFITLSQTDYTSEYMESLLYDLIEFRQNRRTYTVVVYEVFDKSDKSYIGYTKKLRDFFVRQSYYTFDLIQPQSTKGLHNITTPHSAKPNAITTKGGRII